MEKKLSDKLVGQNIKIDAKTFLYLKLFAVYEDKEDGSFIVEINGKAVICTIKDDETYAKAYNKSINDLITDDYLIEAVIVLKLKTSDEHITHILHWYAEDDFDLKTMPFTLADIVESYYY